MTTGSTPTGHTHQHGPAPRLPVPRMTRLLALGTLLLVAATTVWGLIALWPDYGAVAEVAARTSSAAPGTAYERGQILTLQECDDTGQGAGLPRDPAGRQTDSAYRPACQLAGVGVESGPETGSTVQVELRGGLAASGLRVGDRIELLLIPAAPDGTGTTAQVQAAAGHGVTGIYRHLPLLVLALVFVAAVIAVGRIRGLLALVALGIAAGVLFAFVLPALVGGGPGVLIGLVGSSAIMLVTLYFVHGPNLRTTAALIGTLCGIVIITGISLVSVAVTRLSGVGDDASGLLSATASGIDFRGLLTCSILIAGLGVLNDVTITQASSVWELRAAAPGMSRRELYRSAMRIGRDHIASTVYTVFFAYAGAATGTLILLYLYNRPLLSLLTTEDIAVEIVRTLCGSVGLVLAVPITTWVATRFVPAGEEAPFERWTAVPGHDRHDAETTQAPDRDR